MLFGNGMNNWAMAQFILATETDDEAEHNARMAEILKYNEEDLAATWAVDLEINWGWTAKDKPQRKQANLGRRDFTLGVFFPCFGTALNAKAPHEGALTAHITFPAHMSGIGWVLFTALETDFCRVKRKNDVVMVNHTTFPKQFRVGQDRLPVFAKIVIQVHVRVVTERQQAWFRTTQHLKIISHAFNKCAIACAISAGHNHMRDRLCGKASDFARASSHRVIQDLKRV